MAYKLEGSMLEVCNCNVLCPCWIGEDPDRGFCNSALAWHFDTGTVNGVNVSDLTIALAVHIPGNALKGNWRAVIYVDEKATSEQHEALLSVFTGKGTTLRDTVFSTIAGAPAYVSKAPTFKMESPELDLSFELQNHNAVQGAFLFEG